MQSLRYLLCLAALAVPSAALATPITYTLTFVGTGTLGTTAFTNAAVSFTEVADTADIVNHGYYYTNGGAITLSIAGLGDTSLASDVVFADQSAYPSAGSGLYAVLQPSNNTFYGIIGPAFDSYFLNTPLAPGTGTPLVFAYGSILTTTSGDLQFSSFTSGVGSASIVSVTPEPSGLALLGTGMLGFVAVARRRVQASRPISAAQSH